MRSLPPQLQWFALHMVVCHRYALAPTKLNSQGAISKVALEDPTAGTDLPRLISSRTPLCFAVPIPYGLRETVENNLNGLCKSGILEKVTNSKE